MEHLNKKFAVNYATGILTKGLKIRLRVPAMSANFQLLRELIFVDTITNFSTTRTKLPSG